MKNFVIILSFISLGITTATAQYRYDWGIEGGPNLSFFRIKNSGLLDPSAAVFGSGGFIFQYNTKKILSFKTGFSYQRKGYQVNDVIFSDNSGNELSNGKLVASFDYITLPLLVKASFGEKIRFFVNAGPYAGFMLGQTVRFVGNNTKETFQKNDFSNLNRWDFGVAGGIGIAVPIKDFWMVHAELRNYTGLANVGKSPSQLYTNTTDLRLGVVYRLGYRGE